MGLMQLLVRLGLDATGYETGLKKAQSSAAGFGQDLKSHIGGKIKQAFSLESIEENIRRTFEYGCKVQDLSQRLGISTDAVQQWDYAMQQNGGSIESVAGFFEKLAVAREKALKGNSQAIDGFRKLGVSMDQLRTGRLEDIATTISRAFEQGDPQQLIAPLREVGGKAAGELIPAFRDGLAAALSEAPLISPKDIEALDRAGDKWT